MAKISLPFSISTNKLCSVSDCVAQAICKGFCRNHYYRVRRYGEATSHLKTEESLKLYFWSKVAITANPSKCWEWQASLKKTGYGQHFYKGKNWTPHRLAWLFTHGSMPEKPLQILHDCDNRKCANPNHLHTGTIQDNMREKMERGRYRNGYNPPRTHCNRGHLLTDENVKLRILAIGGYTVRECVACSKLRGKASTKRKAERRKQNGV